METLTRRTFLGASAAGLVTAWFPQLTTDGRIRFVPVGRDAQPRTQSSMDRDLLEVTISGLQALYASRKYTVVQVTQWYLDRIARYNPVYRSVLHVDGAAAIATAAALDADAKTGGSRPQRAPLWGVPMVIKSNTSVKGLVTSAGWSGFLIPGFEFVASQDATVVAKLRAAGAVILGQTNMPDFAASDANISSAFGRTGNAYDWRYSPGGSSGGTVTSVAANLAMLGTGTDTANSIRMPAATSALVGVLPTRGLTSIAGIVPLDWLRDNVGPIARTVTDAAIALGVMAGEDQKDFRTKGSAAAAQPSPYTQYLKADALRGKRFGVPAFVVANGMDQPSHDLFMQSLDGLRAAGATVVIDDALLPASFPALVSHVNTSAYAGEGTEALLRDFGPPQYHSPREYAAAVGTPLPATLVPAPRQTTPGGAPPAPRPSVMTDPQADATLWGPQREALAAYDEAFTRFQLDGLAYPAMSIASPDEEALAVSGRRSAGPHSNTGWVNSIGVPAISLPGGFYANGLPFGLALAGPRWKDGDLLGYAFAYEQATHYRHPPTLVDTR